MSEERYQAGLEVRKAVLGEEYVERALASATDFNRDLQDLVTEYCWGAVWTREGLSRKTRSLINIAMLVGLNRPHELRIHVKGARQNGCTDEEISETLLQTAVYAGVPAAIDGFRIAQEALAELDE
jgi:4-carboxymuconolactone decarboxylase